MWIARRAPGGGKLIKFLCALAAAAALVLPPALVAVAVPPQRAVAEDTALPPEVQQDMETLAKLLFDKVEVPPSSVVVGLAEPLQPGTQVVTKGKDNPFSISASISAPTAFFYIDDLPGYKLGHDVRYAYVDLDTMDVNVVTAQERPAIVRDGQTLSPFTPLGQLQLGGPPVVVTTLAPPVRHAVSQPPAAVPASAPGSPPRRVALVIDGGDEDIVVDFRWAFPPVQLGDIADEMADDADRMATALGNKGYEVVRFSNDWGHDLPRLTHRDQVKKAIEDLKLRPGDELFIYIGAHGYHSSTWVNPITGQQSSFGARALLFNPDGSGESESVQYSDLDSYLDSAAAGTTVTVMIDSCFSGEAVTDLAGPGRTILTAVPKDQPAPAGAGITDSFTQDFLKSGFETGPVTILDAFNVAVAEGGSHNSPQIGLPTDGAQSPTGLPRTTQPAPTPAPTAVPRNQAPVVTPLVATFDQPQFLTRYEVTVTDTDDDAVQFTWSGPNCGGWSMTSGEMRLVRTGSRISFSWVHPHPPCDPTTNHRDVTVQVLVTDGVNTVRCQYVGSESGTGPACQPAS